MHISAEQAVNKYLDFRAASTPCLTALKIISYATVIFPVIVLALKALLVCTRRLYTYLYGVHAFQPIWPVSPFEAILRKVPPFLKYRIGQGTPYAGTNLTAVTVRPANLFFEALFGLNATTLPGDGNAYLVFRQAHEQIRKYILNTDPNKVVAFTASGKKGAIQTRKPARRTEIADLGDLYGTATCRFSFGELQSTLKSQKITTCPLLPLPFYRALKTAMQQDEMFILPGSDAAPKKLQDLDTPSCKALFADLPNNWAKHSFKDAAACQRLLNMTLYQIGALVVKTEDFRILLDGNGKLRERNPGERDAIRLINACGIRGIRNTPPEMNKTVVRQMFEAALQAAGEGFVVVPAVGMGVWGGDPDLYWRAFLDAVCVQTGNLERIFINPGHQETRGGTYQGCNGNEFQRILDAYLASAEREGNRQAMQNLAKVENLFARKTDLLHLSHQLKVAYPDKTVSLFNASDPDVTLGYCVGEYVNNLDHAPTTEENYTALGTNGLCFETITGVHGDLARLIQR
jgi:hypothetical protein